MNSNPDKRLVYLATYFYPLIGGVENSSLQITKWAQTHGFQTTVLTSDRRGNEHLPFSENLDGIKIERMRTWFRFSLNLVFYPSLLSKLLHVDADIVVVNYLGIAWHDICLIIKRILSPHTKFILVPQDKFMGHDTYPFYQKIIKWSYTRIQRLFVNSLYNGIIAINPGQKEWMETDFGIHSAKIHLIPPGIPENALEQRDPREIVEKYDLGNHILISYIGRIEKYKGIQDILYILPQLKADFPSIKFVIGGKKTPYYQELEKIISQLNLKDVVVYIDTPTEKEKFEILSASRLFVSPSKSEGFGITTIEAMSQGCPIITYENQGSIYLVKNGENGFISEPKDLTKNIERVLKDHDLHLQISKNNKQKAKQFTWDVILTTKFGPLISKLNENE